jgi:hypothetical protein
MPSLNIDVRLRPVRIAFLVRPDDGKKALEIFRINTCLWGGSFNPVIPFFRRVPSWWEKHGYRLDSPTQIINGYLDFFEPDFIVEATAGLAAGLGFPQERILALSDVLVREGDRNQAGCGLGVFDVYKGLYKREFQFVKRRKHHIVDVQVDDPSFAAFAACVFGSFPRHSKLEYLYQGFQDAFDPSAVRLTAKSMLKLYKSSSTSALRLGRHDIEVDYHGYHEPTLFVVDATQPKDLIDFWNLRAVQPDVVAIPRQWLTVLSPYCKQLIKRAHRPLPNNAHGVMTRATVMFSRSIPELEIRDLHATYFQVDQPGANVLQDWYPPLWRRPPGIVVRTTRPTLKAGDATTDVTLDLENPRARFPTLSPKFADEYGNHRRWANVVRLRGWGAADRLATTFPCNYRQPLYPRFSSSEDGVLPTTEGLTVFPRYKNSSEFWDLDDGTAAITAWLKSANISTRLSPSGRATHQIIDTLDGFFGVRCVANRAVIELLNGMARRPISRSAHYAEFKNQVSNALKGDSWKGKGHELLVERNAVQLGLELKCTKCDSWNWYSLTQLDYVVTCDLCLKRFSFPITDPGSTNNSHWAYRVIGPFAQPDYARGGYSGALAIRFFGSTMGRSDAGVTWSAGQILTLASGAEVEADFIVWYQRKQLLGIDYPTEVIFGEAKSFGNDSIQERDVARLRALAETFPGSILVIATLKEASELSGTELARVRDLAEWGRDYEWAHRRSRAPVILLTGTELYASYGLRQTWKAKGGRHEELAKPGWVQLDRLRTLADLTQQLYLGMPSYSEWARVKWAGRRTARQRPPRKAANA